MKVSVLQPQNISGLESEILDDKGQLKVVPASIYEKYNQEQISILCVQRAFYGLPTIELIEWLVDQISGFESKTIEIGAGNGVLGRSLKVKMTDSFLQENQDIKKYYEQLRQPTITYGQDVEKLDAKQAIKKYKPRIVIASWVTQIWQPGENSGNVYGVDEDFIIKRVKMYIHIGHKGTHSSKRVLRKPHRKYIYPWLFSRSMDSSGCVIYVWRKR